MNFFRWLIGRRSARNEALSFYKRGMAKAEKDQPQAALEAYTSAVELPNAPEDVKAMALYNRALLFAASGNASKAVDDLNAVLALTSQLREIKLASRRRLDRMQRQHDANPAANPQASSSKKSADR